MQSVFPLLSIHPSASAYVAGKNIRNNTEIHADTPYLLKLDFKDFFPSIKGDDFILCMQTNEISLYDVDDLQRLVRILFWLPKKIKQLQLSVGAPSSPYLSNAVMHSFDDEISQFCAQNGVIYSRYADDLAFSMRDKVLRGIVYDKVCEVVKTLPFPRLAINEKKTVFGSKAHRRMLTGLILANDGTVSLGRDRKRRIRAQIHRCIIGKMDDQERGRLRGILAFARDIEPEFVKRMEQKYGVQTIRDI
jgi:retron-type reverse transcriptase